MLTGWGATGAVAALGYGRETWLRVDASLRYDPAHRTIILKMIFKIIYTPATDQGTRGAVPYHSLPQPVDVQRRLEGGLREGVGPCHGCLCPICPWGCHCLPAWRWPRQRTRHRPSRAPARHIVSALIPSASRPIPRSCCTAPTRTPRTKKRERAAWRVENVMLDGTPPHANMPAFKPRISPFVGVFHVQTATGRLVAQ